MSTFFIKQTKNYFQVFASKKIFENQIIETVKINSFHKLSSHDKLYLGPQKYACITGSYLYFKPDLYPNCKIMKDGDSEGYHVIALHDINKNEELTRMFDRLQISIQNKQININMK
jgi:hypothetical protein